MPEQTKRQTKSLIQKYGGAVPRYTSYPTAVQFDERFTEEHHISCLMDLCCGERVSLYIHIPFCHSLCHYCGCHTKIVSHTGVISAYIDTLCREIALAAPYVPKDTVVSRIHFGGGSPNYAPVADIQKILDTVRDTFSVAADVQIDMECDPRLLTLEKIAGLSELGLRRVSLGIQDFDERVQKAVNRIQPLGHVKEQVAFLRQHEINDINFDLITGLPEQTRDSVRETVAETLKIRPPRIAVFSYAHVPWMKKHQKLLEKYRFPSAEERFSMQEEIKETLCAAGYDAIGIDHYALPEDSLSKAQKSGAMRRNFQGYTDDPATSVLGFGLSAISQFKGAYAQNMLDAPSYRKAVEKGRLPVAKGYRLNAQDFAAREVIMQIMCHFHLDLRTVQNAGAAAAQLARLEQDGIIRRAGDIISITDMGKPFTRVVAACFDHYFQKDSYKKEGRHAKAI